MGEGVKDWDLSQELHQLLGFAFNVVSKHFV